MRKRLVLLLIFILFLTGCEYKRVVIPGKKDQNSYTVEVYEKILISTLVNKEVIDDNYLDTSDIKDYNISYTTKDKKTHQVSIKVRDTTPPKVMLIKNYNHIIGTNFTIKKDIVCVDNYDKNPNCEVIGDYDLNKLGTYPAVYKATDSSGNKFESNFNINVVEKPISKTNLMSFEDVKKIVAQENGKLLIDVSNWEKNIDWKKVKASGIEYAFLRLGTHKYNTNDLYIDATFEKYYKEATKYGIKLGVYFYTYAKDKDEIVRHANYVISKLKGKNVPLGVALDWECWDLFNDYHITSKDLNDMANAFLKVIKDNGYKPVIYSSKNYLENVWVVDDAYIWMAHYTNKSNYAGKRYIWQFSPYGIIPGIKEDVDVNVYYGD